MDCINLRERFGRQYKVTMEESYYAERGEHGRADDPALQIIPCRAGHIYPWDASTLAAFRSRGPTARRLAALDFATVHQDGDDGLTVLFPVERFPEVAELMKPKRRRQMTEAQRARLAEMGAKTRFQDGVQSPCGAQIRVGTAQAVV